MTKDLGLRFSIPTVEKNLSKCVGEWKCCTGDMTESPEKCVMHRVLFHISLSDPYESLLRGPSILANELDVKE